MENMCFSIRNDISSADFAKTVAPTRMKFFRWIDLTQHFILSSYIDNRFSKLVCQSGKYVFFDSKRYSDSEFLGNSCNFDDEISQLNSILHAPLIAKTEGAGVENVFFHMEKLLKWE